MDLEAAETPSTQLAWYFACGAFLEFVSFLVTIAVVLAIREAQAAALDTGILTVCLVLLVPFHLCGLSLIFYPLQRWRGHQKFRELLVQTDRTEIHPGDPLYVTIHLQPHEAMPVEFLSASLRCTETTDSGDGAHPTSRVLSTHESRLSPAIILDSGRRSTYGFATQIPPDSSPSIEQGPRRVTWTLCLLLPTTAEPGQRREFQVPVVPHPTA